MAELHVLKDLHKLLPKLISRCLRPPPLGLLIRFFRKGRLFASPTTRLPPPHCLLFFGLTCVACLMVVSQFPLLFTLLFPFSLAPGVSVFGVDFLVAGLGVCHSA